MFGTVSLIRTSHPSGFRSQALAGWLLWLSWAGPLATWVAPEKRRFLAVFKRIVTRYGVMNQTLGTHGKGRSKKKAFPSWIF